MTKTPGATSLCWHPKGRLKPSTDPLTSDAAKPHWDSYLLGCTFQRRSTTPTTTAARQTLTQCWISECDKLRVLSDMLLAVRRLHGVWLNKETNVHVGWHMWFVNRGSNIKGIVWHCYALLWRVSCEDWHAHIFMLNHSQETVMCVGTMVVWHTTITTEIQKKYNQTSPWYVHKFKKKKILCFAPNKLKVWFSIVRQREITRQQYQRNNCTHYLYYNMWDMNFSFHIFFAQRVEKRPKSQLSV